MGLPEGPAVVAALAPPAALVRLAQRNPDVGAVVVACLLPGLRALLARYARGVEPSEALAEATVALWESFACHSAGETSFVANRLLQLPRRRLQRAATVQDMWRCSSRQQPEAASDGVAQVELSLTVMLRLAVDAEVLTTADAWLIHATRVAGHTLGWAARQLGIGYEAAKKRRQRAEAWWAAWWSGDDRGLAQGRPDRADEAA